MRTVTRFAPTVTSGHMHVGNILNLLLNAVYAKQHDGLFYFCPETVFSFAWGAQWATLVFHWNMEVAQKFSLMGNCCMPIPTAQFGSLQKHYQNERLVSAGIPEWSVEDGGLAHDDIPKEEMMLGRSFPIPPMALNDFHLGVNTIIRGRDFKYKPLLAVDELQRNGALGELRRRAGVHEPVKYLYHPLITGPDGKLSKSKDDVFSIYRMAFVHHNLCPNCQKPLPGEEEWSYTWKDAVVDNGHFQHYCFPTVLIYLLEKLSAKVITSVEEAVELSTALDVEGLSELDDIVFVADELAATYERVSAFEGFVDFPAHNKAVTGPMYRVAFETCRRILFEKGDQ